MVVPQSVAGRYGHPGHEVLLAGGHCAAEGNRGATGSYLGGFSQALPVGVELSAEDFAVNMEDTLSLFMWPTDC